NQYQSSCFQWFKDTKMYCYPPGFQNQGEAYHLGMTPEQEMLVKTTQI
ncbi:hypothetical protein SAMN05192581_100289, partial [Bacteroides ovatus]